MSQFDDLVAKYRNLNYGSLQSQNPSSVSSLLDDYNDRKFFTTHSDSMGNRFVRDEFGRLQFSTPEMGLLSDGTGYATYDPYFDYGDPGYADAFQPNEDYLVDGQTITPMQRGGDGRENLARFNEMRDRQRLRDEIAESFDKFNMLPGYEESNLPGLLGFLDETISNFDREQQINNVMRDINASTSFQDDISGGSYTGSSGTDPSGGATPTSGPSGVDADTGKFSGGTQTGGGQFGGPSGHGSGQQGGQHGPAGGQGGQNTGTSRF
tara:strand:+ start:637 stop:1434 length:798 start_codon:yes stop_codon:yes gene_type:complete